MMSRPPLPPARPVSDPSSPAWSPLPPSDAQTPLPPGALVRRFEQALTGQGEAGAVPAELLAEWLAVAWGLAGRAPAPSGAWQATTGSATDSAGGRGTVAGLLPGTLPAEMAELAEAVAAALQAWQAGDALPLGAGAGPGPLPLASDPSLATGQAAVATMPLENLPAGASGQALSTTGPRIARPPGARAWPFQAAWPASGPGSTPGPDRGQRLVSNLGGPAGPQPAFAPPDRALGASPGPVDGGGLVEADPRREEASAPSTATPPPPPDPTAAGLSLAGLAGSDAPAASAAPSPAAAVWQQMQSAVLRMAAGTGSAGVHQVRLDIDPRLLPGVQVVLQLMAGQVQLEFVCAGEGTRRRLRAVAQRELGAMAERLGRPVHLSLRGVAAGAAADDDAEHLHAGA